MATICSGADSESDLSWEQIFRQVYHHLKLARIGGDWKWKAAGEDSACLRNVLSLAVFRTDQTIHNYVSSVASGAFSETRHSLYSTEIH